MSNLVREGLIVVVAVALGVLLLRSGPLRRYVARQNEAKARARTDPRTSSGTARAMVGTFLLALFVFVIKAALINFYAFRRVPAALRTQMEQSQATAGIALSIVFFFFFLVPGIYLIYSGWRRPQTLRLPVVILGLVLLGSVLAPPRAKPSERACAGPGVLFYLTGDTWTRGAGIWEKGDAGSTLVAQLGGMASDSACFPVAPGKHVFVIGGDPDQPGADRVEVMVEPGKTRRVRIEVRATGATRQGLRTVIGYYTMRVTVEP